MTESRSTKRQKELLDFVDGFIKEHGYGPSYREIMNGIGYASVSTVAIHINGLISKGYLRKNDNSARSLEVVSAEYKASGGPAATSSKHAAHEKWIVGVINEHFTRYQSSPSQQALDELYVLVGVLKILQFDAAYEAMRAKLVTIMQK